MPATRILCCADSSDRRRTCAMSGLDAGASKDQLTAVRGLLRRAEASRSPHLGAANAARESPRKTRIPRPERFGLGTPGGAGGTRPHKRDASHLRRCRNNGHSHPFSSGCDPLDPARMGIGWASPHHPPRPRTALLPRGKARTSPCSTNGSSPYDGRPRCPRTPHAVTVRSAGPSGGPAVGCL